MLKRGLNLHRHGKPRRPPCRHPPLLSASQTFPRTAGNNPCFKGGFLSAVLFKKSAQKLLLRGISVQFARCVKRVQTAFGGTPHFFPITSYFLPKSKHPARVERASLKLARQFLRGVLSYTIAAPSARTNSLWLLNRPWGRRGRRASRGALSEPSSWRQPCRRASLRARGTSGSGTSSEPHRE